MSKFLLPFAEGHKKMTIFSPAAMLVAAVATGIIITVQSSPSVVATLILCIFIGGSLAKTRWRDVLSLALRFEVVIMVWVLLEPFLYGSTVIAVLWTPIGYFNIYTEGVRLGILLGLRMIALLLLFLVTLSHMTLSDFIKALRTLHVPSVLIGSLMVMLRYIPLFIEERSQMHEAQLLRGFQEGSRWERITSLGYLVGSTIDRALDRSMSVYEAMVLRGFSTANDNYPTDLRRGDAVLLAMVPIIVLSIQFVLPALLDVVFSWIPL